MENHAVKTTANRNQTARMEEISASQSSLEARRAELARQVAARVPSDGVVKTALPGLGLYRRSITSPCNSATYEPTLIVFLQGAKRINVGSESYLCDGTTYLLTSIDLPVVSEIVEASIEKPMLGIVLELDMATVREILGQQEFQHAQSGSGPRGMAVGRTTPELFDACTRLVALLDRPQEMGFLSGLIQREIVYRILSGPQGHHLRAIATHGEQGNRTAKAVAWLRENFSRPLRVEQLAAMAHMGVSTFHHHFRTLTQMSPLQYQKHLRLHMARERMVTAGIDAASAAFEVGYESASQFSREYARFFGQPPMRDVKTRRGVVAAAADD
jgi:AraC-like DNA-binding protein